MHYFIILLISLNINHIGYIKIKCKLYKNPNDYKHLRKHVKERTLFSLSWYSLIVRWRSHERINGRVRDL